MRFANLPLARLFLGVAGLSVAAAGPVAAHHSFALFDADKHVMLEGTVKKFEWTNPHSWITLEVVGANKAAEQWLIELPAAGALAREGWNKNFVKEGERISVRINPLKDGGRGGVLEGFSPGQQ
jgi:hypothetical protein